MPLTMRKPQHFIFERGTVSGPNSSDLAVVEWRLVDARANELVNSIGRVKQIAISGVLRHLGGHERERNRCVVAMFHVEHSAPHCIFKVDRLPGQTRRRTRLQATPCESNILNGFSKIP